MKKIPPFFLLQVMLLLVGVSLSSALDVTARYFRFTPTKLRETFANSIQLAEFDMLYHGTRLTGATVTNPLGNNPGGEIPAYVVDGLTSTKWLDFNKGALVLSYPAPVTADGYRFATANDAKERDPVSWVLEASDDGTTWSEVETKTDYPSPVDRFTYTPAILFQSPVPLTINEFTTSRPRVGTGESATLSWNTVGSTSVTIDNGVGPVAETGTFSVSPAADTTYTLTATKGAETLTRQVTITVVPTGPHTAQYFRFNPTRLRATTSNSIQLGEFEVTSGGNTVTGATATNPTGSNPVGEGPANAVDGSAATKWLDYNKSALVLTFPAPVTIDGYRFATANDFDDRDPLDWTFEASNDGVNWVIFDSVTNFPTPLPRQTFTGVVPLPLMLPPSATLSAGPLHIQRGETTVLTWTSEDAETVTITPSVPNGSAPNGTEILTPQETTTYTLTATNSIGSVTRTVKVLVEPTAQQVTWKYFRFTPTTLRDGVLANSIQISEFELSLDRVPVTGAIASNPGGNNPAAELPGFVVDGSTSTKWLDFNRAPLVLEFPNPVTIDGYRFATANDSPERDPIAWTLEGSNDGTTWSVFDTRDVGFVIPSERFVYTNYFHFAGVVGEDTKIPVTQIVYDAPSHTVTIVWDSETTRTYRVETSTDLQTWTVASDNIVPEGTVTGQTFPVEGEKLFYQVIRKK